MTEAVIDSTELKALDGQDDPLALLEEVECVFVCNWSAEESGFGDDGNWRTVSREFAATGRSAAEVLEVIAAECVRQDADPKFDYVRAFGPMREISLVSRDMIDADDFAGTMAFRSRRAAQAAEARKKADAAARAEDAATARRRAAYEQLRTEFEPKPGPRAELSPVERAAQAAMLEYAERDGGRFMYHDLVRIGDDLDIEHPEPLVDDLVDRGFLRDLGVWNSVGVMHGERCLALKPTRR